MLLQLLTCARTKIDQVDSTLRDISSFLEKTKQYSKDDCIMSEPDGDTLETLEINSKIRAFANNLATNIVMKEPIIPLRTSIALVAHLNGDQASHLIVAPTRKQLDYEWAENRLALKQLQEYHLYENAVEIQRRALEIKVLMAAPDRQIWEDTEEHTIMREDLADLLFHCEADKYQQEALEILQDQLDTLTAKKDDLTSVPSPARIQKCHSLHFKLGKIYKERGHLNSAMDHLRTAFDAFESGDPRDTQKIQAVGAHLLELYEFQVQESYGTQRAVRITQRRAFRKELQSALGQSLAEHQAAVSWCACANIDIQRMDQRYRFDIVVQDSDSSPLHVAAKMCQDHTVLQQMIENSDILENLNGDHETPLLVAVGNSNTIAIELLLKNGASIKARDLEGQTVLHKSQKPRVIRIFLQHIGMLRRNSTLTHISTMGTQDSCRDSASTSATTETGPTISNFQSNDELDIDAQDNYERTALWTACYVGRAKTVSLLLAADADPNISRHSQTPLAAVIESRARFYLEYPQQKLNIVRALICAGADSSLGKVLLHKPRNGLERQILQALEGQPSPIPRLLSTSESSTSKSSSSSGFIKTPFCCRLPRQDRCDSWE